MVHFRCLHLENKYRGVLWVHLHGKVGLLHEFVEGGAIRDSSLPTHVEDLDSTMKEQEAESFHKEGICLDVKEYVGGDDVIKGVRRDPGVTPCMGDMLGPFTT